MVPLYAMNAVGANPYLYVALFFIVVLFCLTQFNMHPALIFQWLGMIIPAQSIYFDSLRECYEAYVIYNFMIFLFNYLNEEEVNFVANLELKPQTKHLFPLCCLPTWEMGRFVK